MSILPATLPTVRIYRNQSTTDFCIMQLAKVEEGHLVGWGNLIHINRDVASVQLPKFIIDSLNTFGDRDGRITSGRLKLKGQRPLHLDFELISVKKLSSNSLELNGYARRSEGYEPLDGMKQIIESDTASVALLSRLDALFDRLSPVV
jgi:hypothetical protein